MCECENILPKTIALVLTLIFYLLGTVLMGFGLYTYTQYKDQSFFDAYLVQPFATNETDDYIAMLRRDNGTNVTDAELEEAFNAFDLKFDIVARKTVVEHAWSPRAATDLDGNYRLSYFLEGFQTGTQDVMALIEENCKSAECLKEVEEALAADQKSLLPGGGKVNPVLDNLLDKADKAKASDAEDKKDDAAETKDDAETKRRREGTDDKAKSGEEKPEETKTSGEEKPEEEKPKEEKPENLHQLRKLITKDVEHLKIIGFVDDETSTIDEEEFGAGFETADVLRSFKLNWGVILVIAAIFFVLGTLTYCSLKNSCMAILLAAICFGLGLFLLLNYLSSIGVPTARKALESAGLSGTIMDLQDQLNDNPTAKAALDSILSFWQPWYMMVASAFMIILALIFIKLACCSNFFISAGKKVF